MSDPSYTPKRHLSSDFLIDFQDVVDELFTGDRFDLTLHKTHKPAPDVLISILEDSLGLAIPEEVLSLYTQHSDGLELAWEFEPDDDIWVNGGSVQILDSAKVFGSWLDELWGAGEGLSDDALDFTWELRGIEAPTIPNSSYRTVVHVPEFSPSYTLYFHEPGGQTHKLNVGFADYVRCALETRGFIGWQFLVSDVDFEQHPLAKERAEAFHLWMPRLFDDIDWSRYRTLS